VERAAPVAPAGSAWTARDSALFALLFFAAALLYAPTLGFDFIAFDDRHCIAENPWIARGLSFASLRWAFSAFECANWYPVTWLSFLLETELHGVDPHGSHAANAALHGLATGLAYRVFRRATGRRGASAALAAFFAVHPLHVEAVAWVSERKELLGACFGLLAIDAYVSWTRAGGKLRYAGVVAAMALSLLSKPTWVSLPVLLLLVDFWPLGRIPARSARAFTARALEKLPLAALSLFSCAIALVAQAHAREPGATVSAPARLANAVSALARYLELTFWPVRLSILHPHPYQPGATPLSALRIGYATALVIAVTALVWRLRERRYLLVGWLWFLVALLPMIGLVQVGMQGFAERYTYLPHLGLFAALAFALGDAVGFLRERHRGWARCAVAGVAAVGVCFAAIAERRIGAWRDTITLYERSLEATPRSPWLLFNLGNQLFARGDHAGAIARWESALALWPDMPSARASLAWALATTSDSAQRDPARALALARELAEQDGFRDPNLLDTLAAALAASGDFEAAQAAATRGLEIARGSGRAGLAAQIEARLRGYLERRPYNEVPFGQGESR
jgi:protein O-mannosyl-transferase